MRLDNVESFYPLSPAQQGILFHSVYDPSAHNYFGQLGFTFHEAVNVPAFQKAWQSLVQRHAVLRTFFVWEGLTEPVQVVRENISVDIEQLDWRTVSATEQQLRLDSFLKADLERSLDLGKAPLMRLTLIRLQDDQNRFIWSHHHILLDGWSAPIVLNELLELYVSYRDGRELRLDPPRQYRDYIVWLSKQETKKAEAHWRKLLAGFESPIVLGIEKRVQPGDIQQSQEPAGDQVVEVSGDLLKRLQELGRKQRVTLNTIVQGAWAILLNAYCGETDLVYGATVSGRPADLEGADGIVGLFINTLPVRLKIDAETRILDFLKKVQEQLVEMRQYEYSRLVDVQSWSNVRGGASLFDTIFVFENYPVRKISNETGSALNVGDLTFHQKTNYSLTVAAGLSDKLTLRALYSVDKYASAAIGQLLRHFVNVLEEIVQSPLQSISNVQVLCRDERDRILNGWNASNLDYPRDIDIARQFEKAADLYPEHIAVVTETERLTYRELDARANQLAHYLSTRGVAPEHAVGLCVERDAGLVVGLLAILKAGGAYLPLDAGYPAARLKYMMDDSGATVVLTQSKFIAQIAQPGVDFVVIDQAQDAIAACSKERLSSSASSENLAYLIYTSGSTGQPKGVMVQHRSLSNLVRALREGFRITSESQVLQFASFSFDASVAEIFPALLTGAALHLAPSENLRPGPDLFIVLQNRKISMVILSPSILAVLPGERLPHLRTLVSAGEACSQEVVRRWAADRGFINAYGPTETTVCASMSGPLHPQELPHIGRPTPNSRIYILDRHLRPVPLGVAGEIYIGGELLARGYRNRSDLTAERFLPDPFSITAGSRMYRTGDLACYCDNGNIEFIGRCDHQIKIRGFRIEPGEIEAILEQDSQVGKALVIVREDLPGDRRLVAYVTPSGETVNTNELNDLLKSRLPGYMVPSAIISLASFPMTTSGKLDRQALPLPSDQRPEESGADLLPRNETEKTIARIWCEVLRLEKVGIQENFFDLGGHSLLMLQVHGKLKEAFGKEISMIQMFGHPTISSLAEFFSQSESQSRTGKSTFASIQERVNRQRALLKKQTPQRQPVSKTTEPQLQ